MILKICDNDGFLALVNNEQYNSFYAKDWELEGVFNHFIDEMNEVCFVIWRTGYDGGNFKVLFTENKSDRIAYREFTTFIDVTNEKLFLSEYASLTMAASYETSKIPAKHQSELFVPLKNGYYSVLIRQLYEPDSIDHKYEWQFEIVLSKKNRKQHNKVSKIPWFEG